MALMVPGHPQWHDFAQQLDAAGRAGLATDPAWGQGTLATSRALLATFPGVDVDASLAALAATSDASLALGPRLSSVVAYRLLLVEQRDREARQRRARNNQWLHADAGDSPAIR